MKDRVGGGGEKVWSSGSKTAVRFYPYDSVGMRMAPPYCDSSNQRTLVDLKKEKNMFPRGSCFIMPCY